MNYFAALADPTRFRIVELLASRGQLSASAIAAQFTISAPAISQHLKMLRQAKLVQVQVKAQQRLYRLNPEGMNDIENWLTHLKVTWEAQRDVLDHLLDSPETPSPKEQPMANPSFRIARTFNAPPDRVWKAWTEESQLKQWFGPKNCPIVVSNLNFRTGGTYHYGMKFPNDTVLYGKWTFRDIKPAQEIEFLVSFTDAEGKQPTRNPFNSQWPLQTLSRVIFTETAEGTEVTVEGDAYEATLEEQNAFSQGNSSMQQGWGGTFEQLEEFLK